MLDETKVMKNVLMHNLQTNETTRGYFYRKKGNGDEIFVNIPTFIGCMVYIFDHQLTLFFQLSVCRLIFCEDYRLSEH